jgi:hypothetical protein
MNTNIHGTTGRGARVLLAAAIATATMASGNAALANGDRTIAISGNSVFSDCGAAGSDFGLLMTGDLKGCLSIFIQSFTSRSCPTSITTRSAVARLLSAHGAASKADSARSTPSMRPTARVSASPSISPSS